MRRLGSALLIAIGIFGIALAVLLPTYVVSHSKKTPLDLNVVIRSTGSGQLLDATTNTVKTVQIRATRTVKTDSHDSDGKNTTVQEVLCLVIVSGPTPDCVRSSDPRILSVTTDRVTADRVTGEAVNIAKWGGNVNGNTSVKHSGMAYKWPIDSQKKTYQFFQPELKAAFPAVYQGEAKIDGLNTYIYQCDIPAQPYQVLDTFPGTLTDSRTVWVEPQTGAIIKGSEHIVQTISASGQVALDTTLTFDSPSVKAQADYATSKINALKVARIWAPLGAGVIGLLALIAGILLARRGDSSEGSRRVDGDGPDGSAAAESGGVSLLEGGHS
jgi:hypothetical protein